MMRRIPGMGAIWAVLCAAGVAGAAPVGFTVNGQQSQVLLCEQTGALGFIPRVFLSGNVTLDFEGTPPIPAAGQAALTAPVIALAGTADPAQAGNAFIVDALNFTSPADGVTTTSAGFVEAVGDDIDSLVIDQFGFALTGQVSLDLDPPNPPTEFPLAESFSEAAPEAGAVDFNGVIGSLDLASDCDLTGICGFTNGGPGSVPDNLDQACVGDVATNLCQAGDFCLDVLIQNTPLGDVNLKVKIILAGYQSTPAAGVLAIRDAANLSSAPTLLDAVSCGGDAGQITQADAILALQRAIGDTTSPGPCGL